MVGGIGLASRCELPFLIMDGVLPPGPSWRLQEGDIVNQGMENEGIDKRGLLRLSDCIQLIGMRPTL